MFRLPVLLGATLLLASVALAETQAEATVRSVIAAMQQRQQTELFPGLLADSFEAWVGGWGPTTCTSYDKTHFIAHISAWQSTWATNQTLFNTHFKSVRQRPDGSWTIALDLQIAYLAKPQFTPDGSPAVNAESVFQYWGLNAEGTQVTRFVELSTLVPASNASAMLNTTRMSTKGLNAKNLTLMDAAYSPDVTVELVGWRTFNKTGWMAFQAANFATRQNSPAFFLEKQFAVCASHVWTRMTAIEQYDLSVAGDNEVGAMVGFATLDGQGRIADAKYWTNNGVVVGH